MSTAPLLSPNLNGLEALLPGTWRSRVKLVDWSAVDGAQVAPEAQTRVAVVDGWEACRILHASLDKKVEHICQLSGGGVEDEVLTSGLMACQPELFLKVPVAAVLRPKSCHLGQTTDVVRLNAKFQRASEKTEVLDSVKLLLQKAGKTESMINDALMVSDEMYTNAVFNAPFIDLKTGFNPGVDRSDWSVQMDAGLIGDISVGFDDKRLVIACRDPYGSLDVRQFLSRILDCCQSGVSANIRMSAGGAGIGSYMVFNAASSLYIGVCRGVISVVAASIHWKWSSRRRAEAPKNIHYFQL